MNKQETDLVPEIYQEATEYINSGIEFNTKTEKIEEQSVIYVDMGAASKYVKDSMDKKYGPAWHCLMGKEWFGLKS